MKRADVTALGMSTHYTRNGLGGVGWGLQLHTKIVCFFDGPNEARGLAVL